MEDREGLAEGRSPPPIRQMKDPRNNLDIGVGLFATTGTLFVRWLYDWLFLKPLPVLFHQGQENIFHGCAVNFVRRNTMLGALEFHYI